MKLGFFKMVSISEISFGLFVDAVHLLDSSSTSNRFLGSNINF